jgi:hypothetical protein
MNTETTNMTAKIEYTQAERRARQARDFAYAMTRAGSFHLTNEEIRERNRIADAEYKRAMAEASLARL